MAILHQPSGHIHCTIAVGCSKSFKLPMGSRLLPLLRSRGFRDHGIHCRGYERVTVRAAADSFNAAETTGPAAGRKRQYSLPSTMEESVDQARIACRQAIRDGEKRLQLGLQLLLEQNRGTS